MTLLCYDFEKHMMITFAIVAAVLIIGLFTQVYGYTDSLGYELTPRVQNALEECLSSEKRPYSEFICPNALKLVLKGYVQEFCKLYGDGGMDVLVEQGLLNPIYRQMTCSYVNQLN